MANENRLEKSFNDSGEELRQVGGRDQVVREVDRGADRPGSRAHADDAGIGPGGGCNDDDDHERDDGPRAEMTSSAAGPGSPSYRLRTWYWQRVQCTGGSGRGRGRRGETRIRQATGRAAFPPPGRGQAVYSPLSPLICGSADASPGVSSPTCVYTRSLSRVSVMSRLRIVS